MDKVRQCRSQRNHKKAGQGCLGVDDAGVTASAGRQTCTGRYTISTQVQSMAALRSHSKIVLVWPWRVGFVSFHYQVLWGCIGQKEADAIVGAVN